MTVHRKTVCDQTGEVLKDGDTVLRPHLTLKGGVFHQSPEVYADGRNVYRPLTEQIRDRFGGVTSKLYAFRDATAMADYFNQRIEDEGLEPLETFDDDKADA
jgi:hypothetical protein